MTNQTDMASGTMSEWFSYNKTPTIPSLVQICKVFDISLSRLVSTDETEFLDAQKKELLAEFERLTEIQREKLLDFIKHAL